LLAIKYALLSFPDEKIQVMEEIEETWKSAYQKVLGNLLLVFGSTSYST